MRSPDCTAKSGKQTPYLSHSATTTISRHVAPIESPVPAETRRVRLLEVALPRCGALPSVTRPSFHGSSLKKPGASGRLWRRYQRLDHLSYSCPSTVKQDALVGLGDA